MNAVKWVGVPFLVGQFVSFTAWLGFIWLVIPDMATAWVTWAAAAEAFRFGAGLGLLIWFFGGVFAGPSKVPAGMQ